MRRSAATALHEARMSEAVFPRRNAGMLGPTGLSMNRIALKVPMDSADTVLVLATGGTIDKQYFDALSKHQIADTTVGRVLMVARVTCPYRIEEVLLKHSLDFTEEDRARLADRVRQAPVERIAITHGTDTTGNRA